MAAKKRIAKATRDGVRLGADAYGYSRAFSYFPNADERRWTSEQIQRVGPEENADSLELWSPGGAAFPPAMQIEEDVVPTMAKLESLLG